MDRQALSLATVDLDAADVALSLAVGRALFLWALDPMMLTRPDTGAILDANPAACRVLGRTVDEIRQRGREGVRDPQDQRWTAALRRRARTGSMAGELSMVRADGSTFPAEMSSAVFTVADTPYAVLIFRDVSQTRLLERQLRDARDEMEQLAMVDPLTGLLNRRGFLTHGPRLVAEAQREQHPVVVVSADVDGLKPVNDSLGHAAGDELLSHVATALTAAVREADLVARIGGDEFAIVLTGLHASAEADRAVERITAQLRETAAAQRLPYPISISLGQATGQPRTAFTLDTLLRQADEQMYAAKRANHQAPAATGQRTAGPHRTSRRP